MCCKADFSSLRKKVKVTKDQLGNGEKKKNWIIKVITQETGTRIWDGDTKNETSSKVECVSY